MPVSTSIKYLPIDRLEPPKDQLVPERARIAVSHRQFGLKPIMPWTPVHKAAFFFRKKLQRPVLEVENGYPSTTLRLAESFDPASTRH